MDELRSTLKAHGVGLELDVTDETLLKVVGLAVVVCGVIGVWGLVAVLRRLFRALGNAINPHGGGGGVNAVLTTAKQRKEDSPKHQEKPVGKKGGKPAVAKQKEHPAPEPAKPAKSKPVEPEYIEARPDAIRVENHTTNFNVVKGFKTPIACTAVSTDPEASLVFIASSDRVYKIMDARSMGAGNDGVVLKIDKADITHAAFDSRGKCLAVYVDNETQIRVYAVDIAGKPPVQLVWEVRLPLMSINAMHVGDGGGYVLLCDDKGNVTAINRRGEKVGTLSIPQGSVKQWTFSTNGKLFGLAAGMASSCRVTNIVSASRGTAHDGPLGKGLEVDVYDLPSKGYYPAIIVEQDSDGTYTVDYKDGTMGYCISKTYIRTKGKLTAGDEYGNMKHVMTLAGHKLNVTCVQFSHDGNRAVTCSKDGCIKVWDIDVRYHLSEEPRLLHSFTDTDYMYFTHAAFSPNNKILVLATPSTSLIFYRLDTKEPTILGEITDSHPGLGPITTLHFTNKHMLTTTAEADVKVKVWDLSKNPYKLEFKK